MVCVGDSLSTGFSVRSLPASIWSARFHRHGGWFNSPSESVNSLARRLASCFPIEAENLSTVSAHAIQPAKREFSHRLLKTRHLADQIDRILARRVLPDVVLFWIGHNDLDLAGRAPQDTMAFSREIADAILAQAERLAADVRFASAPRGIVLFGLVGFDRFFQARDEAESRRKTGKRLYPHFDDSYKIFPSMHPEKRSVMVETARKVNERLEASIAARPCPPEGRVHLRYSDALARTDISRAESLAWSDAWHPSPRGHHLFAAAAEAIVVEEMVRVQKAKEQPRLPTRASGLANRWSKHFKRCRGTTGPLLGVAATWVAMAAIVHWVHLVYDRPVELGLVGPPPKEFPIKELFAAKLTSYRSLDAALHNNMVIQSVFVVLGLFSLLGRSKDVELPVLKLKLPLSWIHYVVPFSLLFVWLHFGFHLDDLINSRVDANKILTAASPETSRAWRAVVDEQLNDSGFADAWFLLFRPGEHHIDESNRGTITLLFPLTFGLLLGLTHATIPGMLIYANVCYSDAIDRFHRPIRVLVRLLPFASLAILLASHRQFYIGGDNPNWFQAWIAAFACLTTLVLLKIPVRKASPEEGANSVVDDAVVPNRPHRLDGVTFDVRSSRPDHSQPNDEHRRP